jgi:hypothetical protein
MERYVFFEASHIPPGLPVIGVPTPKGFVWVEITAKEYETVVSNLEVARQLAAYVGEVLANRLPKIEAPAPG